MSSRALRTIFAITPPDDTKNKPILNDAWLTRPMQRLVHFIRTRFAYKHDLCTHTHGCVPTIVEVGVNVLIFIYIQSATRNFGMAATITSLLHLVTSFRRLTQHPTSVLRTLFSLRVLGLPIMMGALPALYHVCINRNIVKYDLQTVICTCHHHLNSDTRAVHTAAGAVAGLAMFTFQNTSVAMYVLWKLIEVTTNQTLHNCCQILYKNAVRRGQLPQIPFGAILLYTVSTAFCLFAAVVEPHAIRKSYWNFLYNLTGTR